MVLVRCWSDTVEGVSRQFSEVIKCRFPEDSTPKCIFLTTCSAWFLAQLSKPPLRLSLGHSRRVALTQSHSTGYSVKPGLDFNCRFYVYFVFGFTWRVETTSRTPSVSIASRMALLMFSVEDA